jgi:hypothetical protein
MQNSYPVCKLSSDIFTWIILVGIGIYFAMICLK